MCSLIVVVSWLNLVSAVAALYILYKDIWFEHLKIFKNSPVVTLHLLTYSSKGGIGVVDAFPILTLNYVPSETMSSEHLVFLKCYFCC